MADLSDVESALVSLIAQTVYPNGTGQASACVVPVKIYPGWPNKATLDVDLLAGTSHVTVFPTASERNTTRYPKAWETLIVSTPTLTLVINGQQVTVGGVMPSPFAACNMVLCVTGKADYVYAVKSIDTLASIATAMAALVAVDFPSASSAGAVITLPAGAFPKAARVGGSGTSIRELKRQERVFQITIWSETPAHRDAVASIVDIALATNQFVMLADSTSARMIYKSSPITDDMQKANLYRRDLLYSVEYATTQTATNTPVTAVQANMSNQPTGATAPISTTQINI